MKHSVKLSVGERAKLEKMIEENVPENIKVRCYVLLLVDKGAINSLTQKEIAARLKLARPTISALIKEYKEKGKEYYFRNWPHSVNLNVEERRALLKKIDEEKTPKSIKVRANILLHADESVGEHLTQKKIAEFCGVSSLMVSRIIKEYAAYGIEYCLR